MHGLIVRLLSGDCPCLIAAHPRENCHPNNKILVHTCPVTAGITGTVQDIKIYTTATPSPLPLERSDSRLPASIIHSQSFTYQSLECMEYLVQFKVHDNNVIEYTCTAVYSTNMQSHSQLIWCEMAHSKDGHRCVHLDKRLCSMVLVRSVWYAAFYKIIVQQVHV